MSDKVTLIGCGIFQEEVEHVLKEMGVEDVEIIWQEVGLHDNIEKLEEVLSGETDKAREKDSTARVGLLYGMACLPTMKEFAAARGLKVLGPRNCIAAMVGDAKLKELEQARTLVATPGWLRKMWLGRTGTASGWQVDDYRINFGRYDRILMLDSGINPLTDEEIITCYDLVQVPIEVMEINLDYFWKVFKDLIESVKEAG
ncbi:hypothetical protein C4J81_06070 [Deltaproteobacteria bacterium Smac51]|nr:hypothetical protein C4J81_06070 [Deltaproteobacteria bacterium Smac51]